MSYRLGIDIGGTFTDAILWDDAGGAPRIAKVPSTPHDPSEGFLAAARQIVKAAGLRPDQVELIVHGTTVATNAIIEGNTARTAFVTTHGFRDLLEIQRQIRPSLYDLQFEKPTPLVPRNLCFEVAERLDTRGAVLQPLDESDVQRTADALRQAGVASVAVCFLHAYRNSAHEQRTGEILRDALPQASVSLSSEVAPEFREYFRASTTVVNAAVRPVVERYLRAIEQRLRTDGFAAPLLVMQSNGGVLTAASASERPVFMVESGPAAGVIAATYLAECLGRRDVIAFDMGGTTAKAGLVRDGTPSITKDYEVGARAAAGTGAARGGGYPIRTPVIDLVEIGAGGGSIAWVDSGGALRVGPRSAGADPGPACYGRGGTEPTVTDANLVLGRLAPDNFLGGALQLDVDAAWRAVEQRCAQPLGLGVVAAAHGIVEIANAAMTNALHLVSVQRGHDPRDFALIAFGGAGPLHANRLAAELHLPLTVVPSSPGITSAMGLLATDLVHDYSRTLHRPMAAVDAQELEEAFEILEGEGRRVLERDGVARGNIAFRRYMEMRYAGQSFELTVPAPGNGIRDGQLGASVEAFHREHQRAYGFAAPEEPTELVTLRVSAVGRMQRPSLRPASGATGRPAVPHFRHVYFDEAGDFVRCAIYDRYALAPGLRLEGPAIVEELDSTCVLHPGYAATVDELGNLLLAEAATQGPDLVAGGSRAYA
jgi:N-methylhydantoinase A